MPFNLQTFRVRAISATVFTIIMLLGLLWNEWSFIILFIIIHFGCWYEFIKLIKKIKPFSYGYFIPLGLLYITLPVLLMINLGLKSDTFINDMKNESTNTIHYVYIIPCAIIFSIWVNDTMAYIVGSLIGKTPFSKISPKKTWEGTIGGIVLCVVISGFLIIPWLYSSMTLDIIHPVNNIHWLAIAAIAAVFGTMGDLLESKVKRLASVKDSGAIMPGHGGFLDRFDSLLIATPFVWLYIYFVMHDLI